VKLGARVSSLASANWTCLQLDQPVDLAGKQQLWQPGILDAVLLVLF
jgi:hypothetical protein